MPDTYQKQALRFEDQLALLQQRGLEFDDLDRALSQIRAISYVWNPPITPSNDRIFYILLTLRHLLVTTEYGDNWCRDCNALLAPIANNDFLRIAMGMPENWREHPIWTQSNN